MFRKSLLNLLQLPGACQVVQFIRIRFQVIEFEFGTAFGHEPVKGSFQFPTGVQHPVKGMGRILKFLIGTQLHIGPFRHAVPDQLEASVADGTDIVHRITAALAEAIGIFPLLPAQHILPVHVSGYS